MNRGPSHETHLENLASHVLFNTTLITTGTVVILSHSPCQDWDSRKCTSSGNSEEHICKVKANIKGHKDANCESLVAIEAVLNG